MLANEGASWSGREPNVLFQNRGDGTYDEVGNVLGLALRLDSRGVVAADIDGDGDQDLLVTNRNAPLIRIYRNDSRSQGRSVLVDLRASHGDPFAIGAQAVLTCDGRSMLRQVEAGAGFLSQSPPTLHFGVGACRKVDSVEVRWPDGQTQRWQDMPVGQRLTLTQGQAEVALAPLRPQRAAASAPLAEEGVSAPVPDLPLPGFGDGPDTDLRAMAAGTAVLNLWATWCVACIAEMPDLQALAERYAARGVTFAGLVMDERDQAERVPAMLAERGVDYAQYWGSPDLQAPFASLASVPNGAIPMTVILHRGLVRRVIAGAIDPAALAATLDGLLADDGL